MKSVVCTQSYQKDLDAVEAYIAKDSPRAGADMWLRIDDQVALLSDPNFPRRPGRVAGTFELVAHLNYIVILEEDATTVTALNVVHAKRQYLVGAVRLGVGCWRSARRAVRGVCIKIRPQAAKPARGQNMHLAVSG